MVKNFLNKKRGSVSFGIGMMLSMILVIFGVVLAAMFIMNVDMSSFFNELPDFPTVNESEMEEKVFFNCDYLVGFVDKEDGKIYYIEDNDFSTKSFTGLNLNKENEVYYDAGKVKNFLKYFVGGIKANMQVGFLGDNEIFRIRDKFLNKDNYEHEELEERAGEDVISLKKLNEINGSEFNYGALCRMDHSKYVEEINELKKKIDENPCELKMNTCEVISESCYCPSKTQKEKLGNEKKVDESSVVCSEGDFCTLDKGCMKKEGFVSILVRDCGPTLADLGYSGDFMDLSSCQTSEENEIKDYPCICSDVNNKNQICIEDTHKYCYSGGRGCSSLFQGNQEYYDCKIFYDIDKKGDGDKNEFYLQFNEIGDEGSWSIIKDSKNGKITYGIERCQSLVPNDPVFKEGKFCNALIRNKNSFTNGIQIITYYAGIISSDDWIKVIYPSFGGDEEKFSHRKLNDDEEGIKEYLKEIEELCTI